MFLELSSWPSWVSFLSISPSSFLIKNRIRKFNFSLKPAQHQTTGLVVSDEIRKALQKTSYSRRQAYYLVNTFYIIFKRVNISAELQVSSPFFFFLGKNRINKNFMFGTLSQNLTQTSEEKPHPLAAFVPRLLPSLFNLIR